MKEEKIVLYDDEESAKWVTNIEGWVDRNSRFWGTDEHMARYSSSTHRKCDSCGELFHKNSWCTPCHIKKVTERYYSLEKKKWDGEGCVYSDAADRYFFEWEDVLEYCELHDCDVDSMRLIICDPVYPRTIEDDYWEEQLPEDMNLEDCDSELARLVGEVNSYILEEKPILSWMPGKFAVEVDGLV